MTSVFLFHVFQMPEHYPLLLRLSGSNLARHFFQRTKIDPLSFLTEGLLILFTQLYGHTIQRGH